MREELLGVRLGEVPLREKERDIKEVKRGGGGGNRERQTERMGWGGENEK